MATVHREISVAASAESVWSAVRDVGQVHQRLVPGLVTEVSFEAGARNVTFANGFKVHELIVSIDEGLRRIAYASIGGRAKHHNAAMQVISEGPKACRIVWTTDVLPDELAGSIASIKDQAAPIIKRTLEEPKGQVD